MKCKIKVEYNVAFDNYKDIYTSNSPGIAVPEFSVARRTNDEEARLNFNKYSKGEFEFDYEENDTIDELVKELFRYLGFFYDSAFECGPLPLWILQDDILFGVDDLSLNFLSLLDRLKIDKSKILIYLIYSHQAGYVLDAEDGVKYRMYSKERGKHNVPHVHIEFYGDRNASISIIDGEVLSGDVPNKVLKTVRKRITENQYTLISTWNKLTDGLSVDLDNYLKNKKISYKAF